MFSQQEHERNPDDCWSQWERCVLELLPGDRWLLERGGIDPSRPVTFRDDNFVVRLEDDLNEGGGEDLQLDDYMRDMISDRNHPGRFSHGAPLCFLGHWVDRIEKLRPPPGHYFHGLWKRRRQQAMGLAPPEDVAAVDNRDSGDEKQEALQLRQKKPRLSQTAGVASTSSEVVVNQDQLPPRLVVHDLLTLLQDPRHLSDDVGPPLSLE